MKECCGNCRSHKFDTEYQDYYCAELESENYGEFTDYTDLCEEFAERGSMETIIIVGMILFVLWVIIYSTGYMLEMILHPEEIAREYWEEK